MAFLQSINKKGQADTVFEVLITVILLSFVLVVGSYAMSSLSDSKCSKEIDISMRSFSQALVKTASSPLASQYFLFDLPYCFGSAATVSLVLMQDQYICNHYCPGSLGSCFLLKYSNPKDPVAPLRYVCVNISSITNVNTSCPGSPVTDYSAATGTADNTSIDKGKYYISSQSISTPTLCIYKMDDT